MISFAPKQNDGTPKFTLGQIVGTPQQHNFSGEHE